MGLHVIGSGGHAKVVVATARALGWAVERIYEDDERRWGEHVLDVLVTGPIERLKLDAGDAVIAIGDNEVRKQLSGTLRCRWATLVHPTAVVHDSVVIGVGSVVMAQAVIQPDSVIGNHVIVNTAASIDHDCRIGDFAHLGPGVHLCGGVSIGEGTLIGVAGAAIPGVYVGDWATVGAGAVLIGDLEAGALAVGVPGRVTSRRVTLPSKRP